MNNEVKCYALHITQNNSLMAVANDTITNLIKRYNAGILSIDSPEQQPLFYLATLIFRKKEDRDNCYSALKEYNIEVVKEPRIAYVDKKYIE